MRIKALIGLLVVTVVAVIAAFFVVQDSGDSYTASPLTGKAVLPELSQRLAQVTHLALVRGDSKTTLLRQGTGWVVEERGDYPADTVKVRQALIGLAELRYVEPKTRKPQLYPRLEVEDADKKGAKSTLVTISDQKGSLLGELIAGKRRVDQLGGGNDGIYIRKPGDAQSWLASGTLDLSGDTPQWLDTKLFDLPEAQVQQVVLTGADGTILTLQRAKPSDKLALVNMPAGRKLKSDDALDDPAGALGGLELADVQPAKDVVFPAKGVAQAQYTSFDGLVVTLTLMPKPGNAADKDKDASAWAKIAVTGTGKAAPQAATLNAKFAPWVYELAPYKVKSLETKLDDLLAPAKPS